MRVVPMNAEVSVWVRRAVVIAGITIVVGFVMLYLGSQKNFGLAQYLQLAVEGLRGGAVYGLIALGYVTIYKVTDIVNFSQGAFAMVGAMTAVAVNDSEALASSSGGVRLIVAAVAGVLVATVVGVAVERFAVRPARRVERNVEPITLIIVTLGAFIVIQGVAFVIWGANQYTLPAFTTLEARDQTIRFGDVIVKAQSFWIWGSLVVVSIVLYYFFARTMPGKALRAAASNRLAARLMGISTSRMSLYAFGISAALTGLSGVIFAPATRPTYDMGLIIGIKGFVAAIIGGLTNPVGSVVGGLMLGLIENIGAGLTKAGLKDIFAFVILILVLLLRPKGILSRRQKVEKV